MKRLKMDILEEFTTDIKMVNKLEFGDPMYIDNPNSQHVCYKKNFRRANWVGRRVTRKVKMEFDGGLEFTSMDYIIAFAPNEELLETYVNGKRKAHQTERTFEVGVDTARYVMETDVDCAEIRTGSDGLMGTVGEFYRGGTLEGVVAEFTADEYITTEQNHDVLKSLFIAR